MATKRTTRSARKDAKVRRIRNVRPDTVDFRDRLYVPTLVEVPQTIRLEDYRKARVPVLDQGDSGACTGFGLATVAHYLLRTRDVYPDRRAVSPWMFYAMAKRYDEWPGTKYEGSSVRGAMKAWHKHGVCKRDLWAAENGASGPSGPQASDATTRPLGAYYRVNHKDLVAMHAALAEVGILYVSATVHTGWDKVGRNGLIPFRKRVAGGHAFAIVAYDEHGFWIQNSWGRGWGKGGFGRIDYDDWLQNGQDVWVARLGAPVKLQVEKDATRGVSLAARQAMGYTYNELRPHIVLLGNDGHPRDQGTYGTSADDIRTILTDDFARITKNWRKKRLLLYAHGGLVGEKAAVARVADYRKPFLDAGVYPLAFVWRSDYWTTLTNALEDVVRRRRSEGFLDETKDFMLDRLDDTLEPVARTFTGKMEWDEMKENALRATTDAAGGARLVGTLVDELADRFGNSLEIHVACHSAGGIFHAPLVQFLATRGAIAHGPLRGENGLGRRIQTCTLWAPACTMRLFQETYLPVVKQGGIGNLGLFTLTDDAERDDNCAHIYHKSLLYLVSDAFEESVRIPVVHPDGEPILGMAKFVENEKDIQKLKQGKKVTWVHAPNQDPPGSPLASRARHHGDFDDDRLTVRALLARILGVKKTRAEFAFVHSAEANRDRRERLGK